MEVENPEGLWIEPLLTRPKHVAIVALGPSCKSFIRESMTTTGFEHDEVWTVNRGLRAYRHDKIFCMDDFRWLEKKEPKYAEWLQKHDKPIITSTVYPEYPNAVPYPYNDVLETIEDDIFANSTVSYMVAYAIHIRVERFSIYGADYIYPDGNKSEEGGQAVAFLLGMARELGIGHRIPKDSTLLYANKTEMTPDGPKRIRYGYHRIKEMEDERSKKDA